MEGSEFGGRGGKKWPSRGSFIWVGVDPNSCPFFFFFFFFFLYHVFLVKVQELACSASYGVKKTLIPKLRNKGKTIPIISKCVRYLARHQSTG